MTTMTFFTDASFLELRRSAELTPCRVGTHPDELLAEVLPLEQPDQLAWGVLKPVRDVLPVLDPALPQPAAHVSKEVGILGGEVPDDKPPEGQPLDEDAPHQGRNSVRPGGQ